MSGRLCGILLVAAACCAQDAPRDPRRAIIEEIEALAASEPPLLGIDTQLDAAHLLRQHYPAESRRFLDDARGRAAVLRDPATRAYYLVRAAAELARVDAREAEQVCRTFSRRDPSKGIDDPLADCYGVLLRAGLPWEERAAAARRGLAAGGFDTPALRGVLEDAAKQHAEDLGPLFAAAIDAFPTGDANPSEIRELLAQARIAGPYEPGLARQALERAMRSLRRPNFRAAATEVRFQAKVGEKKFETETLREALALQVAGLAALVAPDLFSTYRSDLQSWREQVAGLGWGEWRTLELKEGATNGENAFELEDVETPKVAGLPLADALSLAREQEDPAVRALTLIEILDRPDVPPARRVALAYEALEATPRMKVNVTRLVAQSMLTRRLYELGDLPRAGSAAQMLAETFEKLCRCQDAGCDVIKGREGCSDAVEDFAEYLHEHGIAAESLGLNNRTLRARLLLLALKDQLRAGQPKQ